MNTIKIEVPAGKVIDYKHFQETNEVKFITKFPEKWDITHLDIGWYISDYSTIQKFTTPIGYSFHKNILPTQELAEKMLIFTQLITMRELYRDGWIPDWSDSNTKYTIWFQNNKVLLGEFQNTSQIFSFQTKEIGDLFYDNFKDMIYNCKDLLF